ncbi:hypothetical protein FACS1894190_18210 [Spirochaetia bacterium]|nr:hypothetical protein FACS1894190_18210 [Spirochaetia bacterium]
MFDVFEEYESEVRSYCRDFSAIFEKAINAKLITNTGDEYIDFFAGAGTMNFGHNNPYIKQAVLDYLSSDNIIHALDMYTIAKENFLMVLNNLILKRKNFNYKVMCCGPTGTNAIEAALKLVRKIKKRSMVLSCSGAFHGVTLGSLSITSDLFHRSGAGVPLTNTCFIPYNSNESVEILQNLLEDDHSGVEKPAALFIETVQAEGGVNIASVEWLKSVFNI